MNLIKRLMVYLLIPAMVLSMIPQTVFAQEKVTSLLKYEVTQEMNEDKTEVTISLKVTDTENIQLEKVTLPNGTEKVEDLSEVTYNVSENGKYEFVVDYFKDGIEKEEMIPVEVTELVEKKTEEEIPTEEKENLTDVETTYNLLQTRCV